MLSPRLLVPAILMAIVFLQPERVIASDEEDNLYALVLIAADLYDATQAMTVFDPNEDGQIDAAEQQRLPWKKDVARFDLNRDGKLTHLELAVRQASLRSESESTQFDRNNARTWMRRKDSNGNGQLDPDEIAKGWPDQPEDFDTNKDGVITMAEMVAQFAVNRRMRREMGIEAVDQTGAIRLRDRFDSDKDRKLDPDEWARAPLPRDAKVHDENNDQLLSIMELATMLAKHRRDQGLTTSDQTEIRRLMVIDLNADGKIDKNESQRGEGVFSVGQPVDLSRYDINQDGDVTLAEIEKVIADRRKERGYNASHFTAAQRLLKRNDKNRSKYVEEYEFAEEPGPGQLPAAKFKSMDRNGDQRVGVDEIARYLAAQENEK